MTSDSTPWLFDHARDARPEPGPGPAGREARPDPGAAADGDPERSGPQGGQGVARRQGGAAGKARSPADSPMMQQFAAAKAEVGDALLFFRMGDFYELFHEDAKIAARVLGITLTSRSKGVGSIPMAGVPAKAYEGYLQQLIREGFRVAICDQVEDPAQAKGIVERRVTRIVTAGTVYEDDLLDRRASNFLLAVCPGEDGKVGMAWIDVSTGAFTVGESPLGRLADDVSRLDPAEVIVPESLLHAEAVDDEPPEIVTLLRRASDAPLVSAPEWTFERTTARRALLEGLKVKTLEGFGLDDDHASVPAAGAALAYARDTQRGASVPVTSLRLHDPTSRAGLDRATRSCLEILRTQRTGAREGSLLSVMDGTCTAMGARLLREWLVAPLIDPTPIAQRQGAVAELVERGRVLDDVGGLLDGIPDLERIGSRLMAGRGSPRDLAALRTGLQAIPGLAQTLKGCDAAPLAEAAERLVPLPELLGLLERGLADPPAATLVEGGVIAAGWNTELDELRALRTNGAQAIADFAAAEGGRTGIPSLKVAYNKVFGYYIEITHAQAAQHGVPEHYVRKQTLTSAERYITPELKQLESSILTAEERSRALEADLFTELRAHASEQAEAVRALAREVARVDVLAGFAGLARERGWVRPQVDDGDAIVIEGGRHPVLDVVLPAGQFVPNDVELDHHSARLVLITGPNMAGKSTYIRQVALLVLLAQVGSFVPATRAQVGVVDRIFTRVGAADDLSSGQSTFMVEMTETAAILNGATDRSLVILDEVGRGTSTWDGLSIAWAISEYLYRKIEARTLFATHYHELVELSEEFPAVRNVNVAVREWGDDIAFLHKIVPGGTDRSYGLHVARLAGVPAAVIERGQRILNDLEQRSPDLRPGPQESAAGATEPEPLQEALFPRPAAAILRELQDIDPDLVTPMDALLLLRGLVERASALKPPGPDGDDAA